MINVVITTKIIVIGFIAKILFFSQLFQFWGDIYLVRLERSLLQVEKSDRLLSAKSPVDGFDNE